MNEDTAMDDRAPLLEISQSQDDVWRFPERNLMDEETLDERLQFDRELNERLRQLRERSDVAQRLRRTFSTEGLRSPSPPRYNPNLIEMEDCWLPEPPLQPIQPSNEEPYAFLGYYPKGTATLTYNDVNGNLLCIHDLNLDAIEERSPVIAAAFEQSDRNAQLHLDLLSPAAAQPFLRFLYTGSYDTDIHSEVPTSLLLHCQLYFFASVFDMPDLKSQALMNVLKQCEFACSSPEKPIELCAALRFSYDHAEDNRRVIDEILEYCIQRFADHKLGEDQDFRSLAFDHRPFYSDLAKTCRKRGFEDDSAIDIIRLPYNAQLPAYYASMEETSNPRLKDVVHHFHHSDAFEERRSNRAGKTPLRQSPARPNLDGLSLPLRSARPEATVSDDPASSSEDEGFQLVRPASEMDLTTLTSPTTADDFVVVFRPAVAGSASHVDRTSSASSLSSMLAEIRAADLGSERKSQVDDDAMSSDSDWTLA